jgi:hypothetical protein
LSWLWQPVQKFVVVVTTSTNDGGVREGAGGVREGIGGVRERIGGVLEGMR